MTGYRALELPDMLRKYDVEPVLVAGWETRGVEFPSRPRGAIRHWTYGTTALGWPSMNTLIYGRSDLPGPLCEVAQERAPSTRDDRALVIASGKANHAGAGNWNGLDSNYELLGNEIEWRYDAETFSSRRREVSERIMAALLDCCAPGTPNDNVAEHREYAPTRKIDTNLDGNVMRARMAVLRASAPPIPVPPTDNEDDMAFFARATTNGDVYLIEGNRFTHMRDRNQLNALAAALGIPAQEATLSDEQFNLIVYGRTKVR